LPVCTVLLLWTSRAYAGTRTNTTEEFKEAFSLFDKGSYAYATSDIQTVMAALRPGSWVL